VEDYLDYITNRVLPAPAIRPALEELWSASAFAGSPGTDDQLDQLGCRTTGRPSVIRQTPTAAVMGGQVDQRYRLANRGQHHVPPSRSLQAERNPTLETRKGTR
jgi:hypothetical protein